MRMSIGLQIKKINNLLSRKGISPDLIDIHSRIDRRLNYRENVRGINDFIGRNLFSSEIKGRSNSYELYLKAQESHEQRNKRSRSTDYRMRANKTYYPDNLTKKQYLKWRNNPERHDIEGVDTRGGMI